MIQPDIIPAVDENVWWFIVSGNQILVADDENAPAIPFLPSHEVPGSEVEYTAKIGDYQGEPAFMLMQKEPELKLSGFSWQPLRNTLARSDADLFALGGRACQIQHFLTTHQYCGRCGSLTVQDRDELAVICPECEFQCYPRISPCIIVGIYRDDEILLARGVRHPEGLYSVLAGFVESGESLEQCLHREVYEEAGIQVTDLRYIASQTWPFPHSLMAGFIARYAGGELKIDPSELIAGDWFKIDDLPRIPPPGTIAGKLIATVIAEVKARS
ncbi:NAD(+) diphosphatase [Aliidiomarina shirensis]|uniref:NAD-capped RNA hydrolase NudC n=1 Tax=Aliidiomarina shirensis TaxID=1048642 RepID=A0A432WSI2_9GAMM|nr:NAD(+) diphosphatase [Aliidiomarina shirensis]RUO36719.1 NAD(+) diphosphatase [Aliidiomarina shirensis]